MANIRRLRIGRSLILAVSEVPGRLPVQRSVQTVLVNCLSKLPGSVRDKTCSFANLTHSAAAAASANGAPSSSSHLPVSSSRHLLAGRSLS